MCDCGKLKIIRNCDVKREYTKSCGCYKVKKAQKDRTTHGMSYTKFYRTWYGTEQRCNNKNSPHYKNYGGRGIKNEWKSLKDFKKDMYESYLEHVKKYGEKNTSIDRIDNNGNYSKENCRWATRIQQQRNTRSNIVITYKGRTQCLTGWSKELGMSFSAISWRLNNKWSIKKTFETPAKERKTN